MGARDGAGGEGALNTVGTIFRFHVYTLQTKDIAQPLLAMVFIYVQYRKAERIGLGKAGTKTDGHELTPTTLGLGPNPGHRNEIQQDKVSPASPFQFSTFPCPIRQP